MKHLLQYVFMYSDSTDWVLSSLYAKFRFIIGGGLDYLHSYLMNYFLTDEGKALPEILLTEPQDSGSVLVSVHVKDSNASCQSDKQSPSLIGRVPKPCGMQRDCWKIVADFLTQHSGPAMGWALLPCFSEVLSHRKGSCEGAHDRYMREARIFGGWQDPETGMC